MNLPPIVSPEEWAAAREALLVKEKELTRARDALAAERRRMPRMAVEKETSAWTSGTARTPSSATTGRVFRTYFIDARGDEAMGSTWSYLDITALGRQEEWEDSPEGYPQTPPYGWWNLHDQYGDA